MVVLKPSLISRIKGGFPANGTYKKTIIEFSKHHDLVYFSSVSSSQDTTPTIQGSTASIDQKDNHYLIGTHANYDMVVVDRTSIIGYEGYKSVAHRWYVIQIDLRTAKDLPYIFIGTRQQTKAYYARLLSVHRELRYLSLGSDTKRINVFQSHYAIMSSPAHMQILHGLFTDENIDTIATHHYPFAIEIGGENLSVITDATKPSQQLLDKLLHYGLWLAKEIDQKLA
ncbi:MAG: hypothetical protein WAW80_01080 [Candidatus Saccharimonadales bacterium]